MSKGFIVIQLILVASILGAVYMTSYYMGKTQAMLECADIIHGKGTVDG